jgi:hypothetical protein
MVIGFALLKVQCHISANLLNKGTNQQISGMYMVIGFALLKVQCHISANLLNKGTTKKIADLRTNQMSIISLAELQDLASCHSRPSQVRALGHIRVHDHVRVVHVSGPMSMFSMVLDIQ